MDSISLGMAMLVISVDCCFFFCKHNFILNTGNSTDYVNIYIYKFYRLFSCSVLSNSLWPPAGHQASLSYIISESLFKLMSIESVMPSNHLILCCPLVLPSIFPIIRVFSNKLAPYIRWPKYWSFSFRISPSINNQGWFPIGFHY